MLMNTQYYFNLSDFQQYHNKKLDLFTGDIHEFLLIHGHYNVKRCMTVDCNLLKF